MPRFERQVLAEGKILTYVEHPGFLGATVRITSGDHLTIEINWLLRYSNQVLYVNVVEPLVRLLLAQRGFALLHGACLSRGDKAILVSAPPDTGKTTTVLRCLSEGWFSFLSDDMTVVGPDKVFYGFPKPLTISAHTYASIIRDELKLKGFRGQTKLRIKSLVHSRSGRRVLRLMGRRNLPILTLNAIGQMVVRPPKVFVEDLIAGVTARRQAQAVAFCTLRKGGERVVPTPANETLEELLANSEDAFGFPPYSHIFRNLTINGRRTSEILSNERSLLAALVNSVKCFRLYSDSRRWDRMLNKIMDEIVKPTPVLAPSETPLMIDAMTSELDPKSLARH